MQTLLIIALLLNSMALIALILIIIGAWNAEKKVLQSTNDYMEKLLTMLHRTENRIKSLKNTIIMTPGRNFKL